MKAEDRSNISIPLSSTKSTIEHCQNLIYQLLSSLISDDRNKLFLDTSLYSASTRYIQNMLKTDKTGLSEQQLFAIGELSGAITVLKTISSSRDKALRALKKARDIPDVDKLISIIYEKGDIDHYTLRQMYSNADALSDTIKQAIEEGLIHKSQYPGKYVTYSLSDAGLVYAQYRHKKRDSLMEALGDEELVDKLLSLGISLL